MTAILFFTGKGGVGKTTLAAATALRLAERGTKTLLVSADVAHSVGDAFGVALDDEPTELAEGLAAAQLDPQRRFETSWAGLRDEVTRLLSGADADPITTAELTVLPGIEEVQTLLAVRDHVADGRWDAVVVDCGPTAETLRLLAMPDTLGWYLDRILPVHRRLARGARPLAGLLGAGYAVPADRVFDQVLAFAEELRSVRALLSDARRTSVRMVLTPETMVVAEARRARTALAVYGYAVDSVVVNRIVPAGVDEWSNRWHAAQVGQLEAVAESFGDVPIHRVEYRPEEPVGLDRLSQVAGLLYGDLPGLDPLATPVSPPALRVRADGADFVLTIELPLIEPGSVSAARSGDELVLTVSSRRRVLALPSVLRRCAVASAQLTSDGLAVRFVRDPRLWPRAER